MAIYHFAVSSVSRRLGQSFVAAWAYIIGTLQTDARTGRIYDYRRKAPEVLATGTVGPTNWQGAEAAEKRWDAKVARTISSLSLAARGITRPARMHLGPERSMQQRKSYRTAAAQHNAAVDEIEQANEAIARANRQIKILSARRRRARVEHQIQQGRRRRLRKRTTPIAVMPESATTNQQAASSSISQPEPAAPATPAPKKPTRRR